MSLKTFFKIGDAHTEISRLTEALAAAEQARDASLAEVTPLKGQIITLEGQVTTLTTERDTARTELATAQGTITAQATEITNLKAAATTVEQRAAEIAAGVGTKTALTEGPGTGAGKTKIEQYRDLQVKDPQAAGIFWAKHKDELFR